MNPSAPAYLLPEVVLGSAIVVAVVLFGWYRAIGRAGLDAPDRRRAFWSGSTLLTLWFLSALALSRGGFFRTTASGIPTLPLGLLIPIAVGVLWFRRSPVLRRIVDSVPQSWIVSVQFYRFEGLIFLTLYASGFLPGPFAWPAGVGDVIVGLLAPVVGMAARREGVLRAWNLLGLADLLVAVTTGFLTSPSPLQLLSLGQPNELISAFPLVLIPVFLVPLSVLLHLASLQKLRQPGRAQTKPRQILTSNLG